MYLFDNYSTYYILYLIVRVKLCLTTSKYQKAAEIKLKCKQINTDHKYIL